MDSVKEVSGFTKHVLSWSLEDICNEDFYRNKVENIPESFESSQQYFSSFVFPLLEEIRTELSSSLKSIAAAPFAEVVSVKKSKPFLFNVRTRLFNSRKEPHITLPEDLFLVMDAKPETVTNSKSINNWALASVRSVPYNSDSPSLTLKLQALKDIRPKGGKGETLFVVFLMNLITHSRIWRSLHSHGNTKIIERVLSSNSMDDEVCGECSLASNAVFSEKLGTRLSPLLNYSQKEAVLCSVRKTFCYHKSSVELIWGPPGTGKTKTVSILLWTILGMNCRVLACAPTNIAMTELASRVVKLLKESYEANESLHPLGDVLLFGNKARLNFGSELEEVHLDYRVEILSRCFGSQTGWNHCLSSMIKLLDNSVQLYKASLKCKLQKKVGKGKKKNVDREDR